MRTVILALVFFSSATIAEQVAVDLDPLPVKDPGWLAYDDGTAAWLTWGGMYRGVWFNDQDFFPSSAGTLIYQAEFWFYHSSSNPWDTSLFYAEVWNGDSSGPTTLLDKTQATAANLMAVFVTYEPPLVAEAEFWVLVNTELSSGGWPAQLGDGTPGTHSFFSDDFTVWEPWGSLGDYFVRAYAEPLQTLDNTTWGTLKTIF